MVPTKASPKKKSADPSKNNEPAKELKRKASVLPEPLNLNLEIVHTYIHIA